MEITLFTDIPVWVRPLAGALEALGADVGVAASPEQVPDDGCVVNRISALQVAREPERSAEWLATLTRWEAAGRRVINGSRCHRIGQSKAAQAQLFEATGVATPRTRAAQPGGRAMPGERVLLKPPAGGFGRGIIALEPGEMPPADLFPPGAGWIEQERVEPADGWVHRLEWVGPRILYGARSPYEPGDFNYCLTQAGPEVELYGPSEMSPRVLAAAERVAREAGLELGALEFFIGMQGVPVFFDINPVSGLHPGAQAFLGDDPWSAIARFLVREATAVGR